ncbi:hypothetical protein D3C87_299250 [compost metagenome]
MFCKIGNALLLKQDVHAMNTMTINHLHHLGCVFYEKNKTPRMTQVDYDCL